MSASCAATRPRRRRSACARWRSAWCSPTRSSRSTSRRTSLVTYLPAPPDDLASAFPGVAIPPSKPPARPVRAAPTAAADAAGVRVAPGGDHHAAEGRHLPRAQRRDLQDTAAPFPLIAAVPADHQAGHPRREGRGRRRTSTPARCAKPPRGRGSSSPHRQLKTVTTYQYDNGELSLIRREFVNNGAVTSTSRRRRRSRSSASPVRRVRGSRRGVDLGHRVRRWWSKVASRHARPSTCAARSSTRCR